MLLLPVWLVFFGLHVVSVLDDGAALPPIFARPMGGDAYPEVGGIRPERISEGIDLQVGDRILRAGDQDLRGVGYISFYAWAVEKADADGLLRLEVERDGRPREVLLTLSSTGIPAARFGLWVLGVGLAALVLIRAPESRSSRAFFTGFTSFSIVWSPFTLDYLGTFVSQSVFDLGGGIALMLLTRFFLIFPDDMDRSRSIPPGFAWFTALFFYVPRFAYLLGGPIPTPWIPTFALAGDIAIGAVVIGAVIWNYRVARPKGRRQLRALLWGVFIGMCPLPIALGLSPLFGDTMVHFGVDLTALTAVAIPISLTFSIVRHDAFDIDRLISATATFTVAVVILLAGLLAIAPGAAALLAEATGIERNAGQLAFAVLASIGLVPLTRALRPRVDQILYPERRALEAGFQQLLADLSELDPAESPVATAAARIERLVGAEGSVLFGRAASGFEPILVSGSQAPPAQPPTRPTLIAIEARHRPMARGQDSLRPLERAALDDLGVEAVVPFLHRGELAALLALGRKRSGEPYAGTDLALLAAAADKVESESVRREDADRIRESGEQMRELEREREEAQRLNLARSRALATASHDLRQPLHAMGLLTEALAGRELDEDTTRLVGRLQTSTRSLEEMFDSLLDLSRLEAGQVDPDPRAVDLVELFERQSAGLAPTAAAKGLALRFEPAGLAVQSDPLWLARILQNLIANAIRYTAQGEVVVSARAVDEEVEIEVRDTGPGIPLEQQRTIFEEFRQLDGRDGVTASGERGLGLGLAIVEGLSRVLGHDLTLESQPGQGTAFRLRLPRTARPEASASAAAMAASAQGLAGLRIVLVDDDPAIREGLAALLEGWGCETLSVGSRAALMEQIDAWAGATAPDLALVDLQLEHGETGLEALEALRRHFDVPIPGVVITGESDRETLQDVRDAGHPLLTKPVAPARLRTSLVRLAGRPRGTD